MTSQVLRNESDLPTAETLLADFIARQLAGESVDFDSFCAQHDDHASDLRRLRDELLHSQSVADGLIRLYGRRKQAPGPNGRDASHHLLAQLAARGEAAGRYEVGDEIARGGMGAILRVRDPDLRRDIAMKILREDKAAARAKDPQASSAFVQRFLEEAQVTAQLSHPGVVPVHELGLDSQGRAYFTMSLVEGRDLQAVYDLVRQGDEDWSVTRAVGVLLKVCETMAYAHARKVVHRDLKPANVMVGRYGEVYVMDWGLAKLARRSVPPASTEEDAPAPVSIDRLEGSKDDPSSASLTMEGTLVGSPGYMSPEQAAGRDLDARSDVYAVGAMLYTLLAGRPPYFAADGGLSPAEIVLATRRGPPQPLDEIAHDAPAELVAICEQAMARDPDERYPDTMEMAEDLRAYLENRVVRAYETGAVAEFRKWVKRNKGLAVASAAALVAVLGGAGGMAVVEHNHRVDVERGRVVAEVSAAPTMLTGLLAEVEKIWPSTPDHVQDLQRWFTRVEGLPARELFEQALASIQGAPSSFVPGEIDPNLEQHIKQALADLDRLPVDGMHQRLEIASTLEERTLSGKDALKRWSAAREAITASAKYGGLRLKPQLGLLPLREDPESHLWEFWHVLSGEEPQVDPATNRWRIEEATGIVLVLIPGGRSFVGAPDVPKGDPLYDEYAPLFKDRRAQEVTLAPFFISKYELTQAQWKRVRGENNSQGRLGPETHPEDTVSWDQANETLRRLHLDFPTEAQWEVAARGGTEWRFFTGQDPASLRDHVILLPDLNADNRVDQSADGSIVEVFGRPWQQHHESVGSCEPNPYGLHDVIGNVWEWCLDTYDPDATELRARDGLRVTTKESPKRILRGGGYNSSWYLGRLTYHYVWERQNGEPDTGVRPARAVVE
jgi:serine/threonine protein kinase/formylglycine-generating enzyme required for sulfatase activity